MRIRRRICVASLCELGRQAFEAHDASSHLLAGDCLLKSTTQVLHSQECAGVDFTEAEEVFLAHGAFACSRAAESRWRP